jgi:hypothetical protein
MFSSRKPPDGPGHQKHGAASPRHKSDNRVTSARQRDPGASGGRDAGVTLDENRCLSARRVRKPRLAVQQI